LIIREAILEDGPRIRAMTTRFLAESLYGTIFRRAATPDAIDSMIALVMQLGAIFLAEHGAGDPRWVQGVDEGVIGMLAMIVVPHQLSSQIIAEEVAWWVEPRARGGSIGPKMLRHAEEWATRNGANMVKMVAPAGSTVGTFYEHSGYQAVETAYIKGL